MTKKFLYALFASVVFTLSLAHAETITQAVNHALSRTSHEHFQNANIGIVVKSMKTGKILYNKGGTHLFTPASVQKLFTASAALEYLSPTYHFPTAIYTTGKLHHGVLKGDLYVCFSGDPSLKLADLRDMIRELKSLNLHTIEGNVYIDNTVYNKVPYPPGVIWDDLSYSYAAPMNAIILDRNKFGITFKPAKQLGHPPKLITKLPEGVSHFVNNMKTTSGYIKDCPITIYSDMHNTYTVGGCLSRQSGKQSRSLAIRNVAQYAKVEVADMLHKKEIYFTGNVGLKKLPKRHTMLVSHSSESLAKLVRHMLKKSDNVYTNAIFKKIGQVYYSQSGSWQNSLHALKSILSIPTGINFKHNLLSDGAGLSRYNLISPMQLTKLLYYVYHNKNIKSSLYAALPIGGWDGTLESRMPSVGNARSVHAKTGSMTGVSALAGYVKTRHHGTLAFAIMVNGFVGKRTPYTHLEDRICEALARV